MGGDSSAWVGSAASAKSVKNFEQVAALSVATADIAAEQGLFNRIRQVAPIRTRVYGVVLETTRFDIANDVSIGSAVFAGLTAVTTHRHTDHATYTG